MWLHNLLRPTLELRTKGPSAAYRGAGRKPKWTTMHSTLLGLLRVRSRLTWTEFRDYWGTTRGGTLHSCLTCFRDAVCNVSGDFIRFPTAPHQLNILAREFGSGWGIPAVGVLDGVHIPFLSSDVDDINRKGNDSMLVLALVDANALFRGVWIGFPGRFNDPGALRFTSLARTTLLMLRAHGYFILADSIFPQSGALITPYDHSTLDERPREERVLQWAIIRTRSVVERAFGLLFARYPWLREMRIRGGRRGDGAEEPGHVVVSRWVETCITLHNIDRIRFLTENRARMRHGAAPWLDPLDTVQPAELVSRQVLHENGYLDIPASQVLGGVQEAEAVRQALIERNNFRERRPDDAAM